MILRGSVYSNTLGMETGLTVIVPNNYGQTSTYKVCYVLHGLCGGNADFSNYTSLPLYAYDKDIVFICPEVQRSFYADMKYGLDYFTYVSKELPETVKLVFNVSARREDTAIVGCSMGGYGALKCALSYPGQYGFCAGLSPACLYTNELLTACREKGYTDFRDFYAIYGEKFEGNKDFDIIELAKSAVDAPEKPQIYCCCGDEDSLLDDNKRFAEDMDAIGYPITFEHWKGEHSLWYFGDAIIKALDFWRGGGEK